MSVFYELLRKNTSLEQVEEMNDLISTVVSNGQLDMELWGLRPDNNFPSECNPMDFDYLGFIGLSKPEGKESIRFVEFVHENKGCEGIMKPFLERLVKHLSKDDKKDMLLIPRVIRSKSKEFWKEYLHKYFTNIQDGENFIIKKKIPDVLNWEELTKFIPSKPLEDECFSYNN